MLGKTNVVIGGGGGGADTIIVRNETGDKIVKGQKVYIKKNCILPSKKTVVSTDPSPYSKYFIYENGNYCHDGKYLYAIDGDLQVKQISTQNYDYSGAEVHDDYGNIGIENGYNSLACIFFKNRETADMKRMLFDGEYSFEGKSGVRGNYIYKCEGKDRIKTGEKFNTTIFDISTALISNGYLFEAVNTRAVADIYKINEEEESLSWVSYTTANLDNNTEYQFLGSTPDKKYALLTTSVIGSRGTSIANVSGLYQGMGSNNKPGYIGIVKHTEGDLLNAPMSNFKELDRLNNNMTSVWYDNHNGILSFVRNYTEINVFKYDPLQEDFKHVPFKIDQADCKNICAPRFTSDMSRAIIAMNLNESNKRTELYQLYYADGYVAIPSNLVFTTESTFVGYANDDCEEGSNVEVSIVYPSTKTDVTFNVNVDATLIVE